MYRIETYAHDWKRWVTEGRAHTEERAILRAIKYLKDNYFGTRARIINESSALSVWEGQTGVDGL